MKRQTLALTFAVLGMAFWLPLIAQAEIRVVASINPVHGLVAGLLDGIGQPSLIVKGVDSPHNYQLKPSDVKTLEQAELIVWVGPSLESSISVAMTNVSKDTTILELSDIRSLRLYPFRDTHIHHHSENEHEDEDHGIAKTETEHDEENVHHSELDIHIWLDLYNAKLMTMEIAKTLIALYPHHSSQLFSNLGFMLLKLNALESELEIQAELIAERPYIVFHDAYQYLEKWLDLNSVAAVTMNPETLPGVRQISELKEEIERTGAICAFAEPQFNPGILHVLQEGTDLEIGLLDPLGATIEPGATAYVEIMRNMVSSLRNCLVG